MIDLITLGIGIVSAVIYMTIGLGAARITAKVKDRGLRLFDLFFWPIVLCVFAMFDDIAD